MKIIHLLDSLNHGGTETLELDVCRNAKENDLDLMFLATGDGTLKKEFQSSGIEFLQPKRRAPLDFALIHRIRKIIKEKDVKIIHAHQPVEGIHAYLAAWRTGAKVVLSHHGFVPDKKNLYTLKYLIPRVDQNIVVSNSLLDWYKDEVKLKFPASTKILFNGVDEKRIKWSGEHLRKELNLPDDSMLFGMIGNFYRDPRKDQLTICKALPKVFSEIENAYFVFVGKTEIGAESKFDECLKICEENNIRNRVFFLGGRSDVPKILNSLDIFVLSSLHEGLPISVLEAMLCGVPCVLSDIEPLLEVSNNGKLAEIFQTQNSDELAEKLLKLIKDRSHAAGLAKRAQNYAINNYSISNHIQNLKTLYNSIV